MIVILRLRSRAWLLGAPVSSIRALASPTHRSHQIGGRTLNELKRPGGGRRIAEDDVVLRVVALGPEPRELGVGHDEAAEADPLEQVAEARGERRVALVEVLQSRARPAGRAGCARSRSGRAAAARPRPTRTSSPTPGRRGRRLRARRPRGGRGAPSAGPRRTARSPAAASARRARARTRPRPACRPRSTRSRRRRARARRPRPAGPPPRSSAPARSGRRRASPGRAGRRGARPGRGARPASRPGRGLPRRAVPGGPTARCPPGSAPRASFVAVSPTRWSTRRSPSDLPKRPSGRKLSARGSDERVRRQLRRAVAAVPGAEEGRRRVARRRGALVLDEPAHVAARSRPGRRSSACRRRTRPRAGTGSRRGSAHGEPTSRT